MRNGWSQTDERQRDRERRSLAEPAVDRHRAVMLLDDPLHQAEAEAGALVDDDRAGSARKNRSKTCRASSGDRPMPVSCTSMRAVAVLARDAHDHASVSAA